MPIEFHCSQCGSLLRTGDDTAGKQAKCPQCEALSTVPDLRPGLPSTLAGTPKESPLGSPPTPDAGTGSPFAAGDSQPGDPANPYQSPSEYSTPTMPVYYGPPPVPTDGRATASMVLGICGLVSMCCCVLISLPLSITGLVLGIMAVRGQSANRGMAVAGIVLSGLALVLTVLLVVGQLAFHFLSVGGPPGW